MSQLDTFRASTDASLTAERSATDALLGDQQTQIDSLTAANQALTTKNTVLVSGVTTVISTIQAEKDSLPAFATFLQSLLDALQGLPLT